MAARALSGLTMTDLPPAWHERFGTRGSGSAAVLSWVLHRGTRHVMTRLPEHLRHRRRSAATAADGRPGPRRASTRPAAVPRSVADSRRARLESFFHQVLDQTGDGRVDSADLQAMVHTICWQLELPVEREDVLYAAFETWWRHLRSAMDADGDGAVDCAEFVSAMLGGVDRDPTYLDEGLKPAVRALFRAADTDGGGHLCADEYRVLFGGSRVHPAELNDGFRQLDTDGDGRISEEEFVTAFADFFTARTDTVAGTALLGRP
ncbi:hypothetical protein GCM10025734_81790 [Kitasatospora paranensis]